MSLSPTYNYLNTTVYLSFASAKNLKMTPQDSVGSSTLSWCCKTKISPNKDMQLTQYIC